MVNPKNGNGNKQWQPSEDDLIFDHLEDDHLFEMRAGKSDPEPETVNSSEVIDQLGGRDELDSTSTLFSLDTLQGNDD